MNESNSAPASIPLLPTADELAIRKSLQSLCAPFDHRYARASYEKGEPATELWDALARAGFVGINIPEEWGGGGLGMQGMQIVAEEIAAATGMGTLMLVVSSSIAGSVLAIHGPLTGTSYIRRCNIRCNIR